MNGVSIVSNNVKLNDTNVHDIGGTTDVVHGIAIWKDNHVSLNGDITNANTHTGFQFALEKEFDQHSRPNTSPRTCGVMTHWSHGDDTSIISTNDEYSLNVINECITGYIGCFDTESHKIFTNENLDLNLSSSPTAEHEEDEKGVYGIVVALRMLTAAVIAITTFLGLIIVGIIRNCQSLTNVVCELIKYYQFCRILRLLKSLFEIVPLACQLDALQYFNLNTENVQRNKYHLAQTISNTKNYTSLPL